MKMRNAKVAPGRLIPAAGDLREGQHVMLRSVEPEEGFRLSPDEKAELLEAIAEADRGEVVDGWQLLTELKARPAGRC